MDNNRQSLATAAKVVAIVVGTLLLLAVLPYLFLFLVFAAAGV